jgi:hypothetical protein
MPLTWRNVDAPDFSSSLSGIRAFSDLFGGALSGARAGLDRFDRSISDEQNSRFAMDLLSYQDPAAYKTALASGAVFEGVDPRRISAGNIQAAGSRAGDLLNQRLTELNTERTGYQYGREKETDAGRDAAAPYVEAALRGEKVPEGAFDRLRFNDRMGLVKDRQAYAVGELGMDSTRLGMKATEQQINQGATRFGWEGQDRQYLLKQRADQENATGFIARLPYSVENQADLEQMYRTPEFLALSPEAQLSVRNGAMSLLGGSLGGGASGGGAPVGGGASGDPARVVTSGGAGNLGVGSVPSNVSTMGQAVEFGKSLNRRGQESSAMGAFQITQSTMEEFGEKALGKDWRTKPFDLQSQDAIARKIFESTGGDPVKLRNRWVSLDPGLAVRVARMPWEQARQVIAGKESGASPAQIDSARFGTNFDSRLAAARSQDAQGRVTSQNPNAAAYTTTQQDTNSTVNDVVSKLIGKDGPYAGTNRGFMTSQVRKLVVDAGVTPATAAKILENATTQKDFNTWDQVFRFTDRYGITKPGGFVAKGLGIDRQETTPNLPGGIRIDDRMVAAELAKVKRGETVETGVDLNTKTELRETLKSAQSAYDAALARLAARQASLQSKPGLVGGASKEMDQVRAAEIARDRAAARLDLYTQKREGQVPPPMAAPVVVARRPAVAKPAPAKPSAWGPQVGRPGVPIWELWGR